MQTRQPKTEAPGHQGVISSPARVATTEPIAVIDRIGTDAYIAPDRARSALLSDPGAIEYASWLRLLRRATP